MFFADATDLLLHKDFEELSMMRIHLANLMTINLLFPYSTRG
jgi:hypothetical protein